jgi:hypothetical protein
MSGGKTTTETKKETGTSSNTLDPEFKSMVMGNYAGAQDKAASLTPYTGQLTAGFTPTQLQAQQQLTGVATDPRYAATNATAMNSTSNVMSNPLDGRINAQTVRTPDTLTPTSVTAGMLRDTNLDPYMNPFTRGVIDTTIADNERSRQIAQVADSQRMTAGNAFGGSRSGVAAALTNEGYDRNMGLQIASLNSDNFNQAQRAAQYDIGNRLGADQFNSTNAMNAGQFNISNSMNTDQFNSNQNVAAQQASFDNGINANNQTLTASGQLMDMNNADLGMAVQQGGILSAVGDAQQNQLQAEYDAAFAAYQNGQQLTLAQQQLLNSALGMVPQQQTVTSSGTSSGTSKESGGGLTGMLGGAGSVMSGLGAMGVVI